MKRRWFEPQRREAEVYEQQSEYKESNPAKIPSSSESLFVELIPEQNSPAMTVPDVPVLRLSYREMNFELPSGFSVAEKDRGSDRPGRLWVTCRGSGPPGIYFNFTENWQSEHPKKMFERFKGYFQSDCYPGYVSIGQREDIIPLGCWAHVKNKFEDAKAIGDKQARQFVILINILYRIEHHIAKLPQEMPEAQKLALRQKRAQRVMKRFFDKVKNTRALPKSTLGKALTYAANHEQPLKNYLLELRFKPDNNAAERAIRPVCIGRRNFLFVGSKRCGETAAIFMSLIATCKANGINPHEYLKDILARINSQPYRQLAELLPHNCKADREKK